MISETACAAGMYFFKQSLFQPSTECAEKLKTAAEIAIRDVLKIHSGEHVLIITNPECVVAQISAALYDAALAAGGNPVVLFQPPKSQIDFAEKSVIAAFSAKPAAVISISAGKLGKDEHGIAAPYSCNGKTYDHIFHAHLYGEKSCRSFWSPSITLDSFIRTVPIDYRLLQNRCKIISEILDEAESVQITAAGGTNIEIGLRGRRAMRDDGDFSAPGSGGNLPAGEVFISPENGTARGIIVFDGSISLENKDIIINKPIFCRILDGFITEIDGGDEASALKDTIEFAERNAFEFECLAKLPCGNGGIYAKNAKNIGELGIGLNPEALITGNMLEDEKSFHTCHFAIGENYDGDAPALIHLDGLVRNPTIIARLPNGEERLIEEKGALVIA
ncbi:MAG: aminopeptidase [Spirochaetaceae bacterium]|jgi:leucyl aminopeptidase (aminopeptidase T)|nr:aminopeptidase [Spirochaetaceae bacterium]